MPDKAQERIAEALQVALFDFLSPMKQGVVSPAQRSALERSARLRMISTRQRAISGTPCR